MSLSYTILGCGSSMGVPRVALGWALAGALAAILGGIVGHHTPTGPSWRGIGRWLRVRLSSVLDG